MVKGFKVLLLLNAVLLLWNLWGTSVHAQRPAPVNAEGVPYLPVNINPTEIPPIVNINPNGEPIKVDVLRLPDIRLPDIRVIPTGCDSRENFQTAVGRSIQGPIVVTYLNVGPQAKATLVTAGTANQGFTFSDTAPLKSALYLRMGQQLNFENDVMYSGCRPA